MFKNISKIISILDYVKKKKEFKILIVASFFVMFLETFGIGSMIPLINHFTNENLLFTYDINLKQFFANFGISENNILNFILVIIIVIYLIKNLYVLLYSWVETKFAYSVRYDLGVRLFAKYLNRPYLFHVENDSSKLSTKILHETAVYHSALTHLSTFLTETLVMSGIILFLLILRPLETLIIIMIGFLLSSTFYFAFKSAFKGVLSVIYSSLQSNNN